MQRLEDLITEKFIPTIFGSVVTEKEREIFSLPIRKGGLGITNLVENASKEFECSKVLTAPLVSLIIMQGDKIPEDSKNARKEIEKKNEKYIEEKSRILKENMTPKEKRTIELAEEKGASNWLNVLPLKDHGFVLNKGEFRDGLALRYNKSIKGLPSKCSCGQLFDITHSMNCKKGGFIHMRHDNIRNFDANLLKLVCNDVEIEPTLQPLSGESLVGQETNNGDDVRLDIRARSFWRNGQSAFFDVRVTNTNSASQINKPVSKIYESHEKEKKRKYSQRIINIEHGTFTPLVFSINGGMGKECEIFHKRLADKMEQKTGQKYEKVITYIRCKLSFLILKAALVCLRGSRSVYGKEQEVSEDIDIALDDLKLR